MNNFSKSDYLKLEYNKINNLFLIKKFDLVIKKTKKIIENNPKQIPFYNFLSLSYRELGNFLLAEKVLLQALKIKPNETSVLINLGSTYRVMIEFEKSEKYLKNALLIDKKNINALVNYANLKRDMNDFDESIELYEKAYKINNKIPTIIINLAGIYQIVGKFELSKKCLEIFLKENPNNTIAHKLLSNIKNYDLEDEHQKKMIQTFDSEELNKVDKATLAFSISKSFEDQKNYQKSFEFFKKANDIQKKIHNKYSVNEEIKLFNKVKDIFKHTKLFEFKNNNKNNKKLIFIVGLPRSGTTLTHQILAAHSKMYGAGEVVIFDQFI